MKRLFAAAVITALAATPTGAQDIRQKLIIGGVDQRVPPMERQSLALQLADKAQAVAHLDALLTVEKEDRKDADKALADVKAELAAAEAQKATLIDWLRAAQQGMAANPETAR